MAVRIHTGIFVAPACARAHNLFHGTELHRLIGRDGREDRIARRAARALAVFLAPVLIAFFSLVVLAESAQAAPHEREAEEVTDRRTGRAIRVARGEVLLRFRNRGLGRADREDFFRQHHLEERAWNDRLDFHRVRLRLPSQALDQALEALSRNPNIEFAEPNVLQTVDAVPNDPSYVGQQQWAYQQSNIDAERAWTIETGSANVIVAVVDNGVDTDHPDLLANIWVNPAPTSGDINGYDFLDDDNNPNPATDSDDHGTPVAGCVGAVGDNGVGASGTIWNVRLMPLRAGASSTINTAAAVEAILYATDHGADVINMSYSSTSFQQVELAAMEYAYARGVVLVGSAGNDDTNQIRYPASYSQVIGVGATSKTNPDSKASFSNYDTPGALVVAPGTTIYTTTINAGYGTKNGTSFSAPITSGAVALIISRLKRLGRAYDPLMIRELLVNTAEPLPNDPTAGAGWDGHGRIKVYAALTAIDSRSFNTLYVSSGGDSTDPGAGVPSKAYPTLAAAVNHAIGDTGVDTIVVFAAGGGDSYQAGVSLPEGLHLMSFRALHGADTGPGGDTLPRLYSPDSHVVCLANRTRVKGFVIGDSTRPSAYSGIFADGIATAHLEELWIAGVETGVHLKDASGCSVLNCTVVNRGRYGIAAFFVSKIHAIRGNRIENCTTGVWLSGIYSNRLEWPRGSVVESNTIGALSYGINFTSGDNVTIRGNTITGGTYGIYASTFETSSIGSNTVSSASNTQIYIGSGTNRNVSIDDNRLSGGTWGIGLYGTTDGVIRGNRITGAQQGILLQSATLDVTVTGNQFTGNTYGIRYVAGSVGATTRFIRNNIFGNGTDNVRNESTDTLLFTRCWFGTIVNTDAAMDLANTSTGTTVVSAFRLGAVDTGAGRDSVAPAAPDTVAASVVSPSSLKVTWSAVTGNESGYPGSTGLAGYRIHRSPTRDTTVWALRGAVPAGTLSFTDSGLVAANDYFYRVTAYDTGSPWVNESFYSDSIATETTPVPFDTTGPNAWYVNDTSTTGDLLTSATGDDANEGVYESAPKRNLRTVLALLTAGDSVYLDAGAYIETGLITVDSVSLIGADSRLTTLDANYESFAIRAVGRTNLRFRNLRLTKASFDLDGFTTIGAGIMLSGVSNVSFESDSFADNNYAIQTGPTSDSITVRNCYFAGNTSGGIFAETTTRGRVTGNVLFSSYLDISGGCDSWIIDNNQCTSTSIALTNSRADSIAGNVLSNAGITLAGTLDALVSANVVSSGAITLSAGADRSWIAGNTVNYNGGTSFEIQSDSNVIENNVALGGGISGYGYRLYSGAESNLVRGNTATGKRGYGYLIQGALCEYRENIASTCQDGGFAIFSGADTCLFVANRAETNYAFGFYVAARANTLLGNRAVGNWDHGFWLFGARQNLLVQNEALSNQDYALYLQSNSAPNTFLKNNFIPSLGRPDSRAYSDTTGAVDVRRTWWGTIDSSAVRRGIVGSGAASVLYWPYRLGFVDTAPGADTIAPSAPDTVAAISLSTTTIRVNWKAVTTTEEAETSVDLAGYRIYSSPLPETSAWILRGTAGPAALVYDDSGRTAGETVFYRVAAFDAHAPYENISAYSDSVAAGRAIPVVFVAVSGESPASRTVSVSETAALVLVSIRGETVVADTLTVFSLEIAGETRALRALTLYVDADRDGAWDAADTSVSNLGWLGGNVYGSGALANDLGSSGESFLVAAGFHDTAAPGDTIRAVVPAFGIRTALTESSPAVAVAAPGVMTIAGESAVHVALNLAAPSGAWILRGESVAVLALALRGDTTASDTLTAFAVAFQGVAVGVDTVLLYEDASGNATRGGDDTFVATLVASNGVFRTSGTLAYSIGTVSRNFLVMASIADTATLGDTFRAYLPAQGAKTSLRDSGPLADTTAPGIFTIAPDTAGRNAWYVNDASTSGDSFSSAAGHAANSGLAPRAPLSTISAALALASPGDTVFVDAGFYAETIVIPADSIVLLGADSRLTTIDPPGESSVATLFACSAANRAGLVIRDLGFTGAYHAIKFSNVDSSLVQSCSATRTFSTAFYVDAATSVADSFASCYAEGSGGGFLFSGDACLVTGNTARSNTRGFTIGGTGSTYTANRSDSSTHASLGQGYFANGASMTVSGNTACGNVAGGFSLGSGASNLFSGNFVYGNSGIQGGFYLTGNSQRVESNTISGNTVGLFINGGDQNIVTGNVISNQSGAGIQLQSGADRNEIHRNLLSGNASYALSLSASSFNRITQNQFDTNSTTNIAQIQITGQSTGDTIQRNNIRLVGGNANSLLNEAGDTALDGRFNYWYVTDSTSIDTRIAGAYESSVIYLPMRTGLVDTSAGADSVAPAAPDTVAAVGDTLYPTINWMASTLDEDGSAQEGLSGYRVYRASAATAGSWTRIADTTGLSASDSGLTPGQTYYYRVTAYDNNGVYGNESWQSDSVASFVPTVPSLDTRIFLGAVPPNFETDSRELSGGAWRTAAGAINPRFLVNTLTLSRRLRVLENTGYGDTVAVYIDSGAGFVLVAESTIISTRSEIALSTMLSGDTNSVRIHVFDTAAIPAAPTVDTGYIFVDAIPPTAPALVGAADGHETSATSVTFAWVSATDTGSGISGCRLQIDTTQAFTAPFIDSATALATSAARTLAANDTYYWRVIAADEAGNTVATASRALFIDTAPPTTPTLSGPAVGHETRATSITFSWAAAVDTFSDLAGYRLQIDTTTAFTSPFIDSATALATSATRTLAANDTYYWRVIAADEAGNTVATGSRALFIDTIPPTAPMLSGAADGHETSATSITFSWSSVVDTFSGLAGYRLQIDTTTAFASPFIDSSTTLATSATRALAANDTYYWRVIATDEAGNTVATGSRALFTDTVPPTFSLVAPAAGAVTSETRPTFSWTLSGVSQVTWSLARDSILASIVETAAGAFSSRQPSGGLDSGAYFWRVIARDTAGNFETSPTRILRIDTSANLFAPSARASISGAAHLLTSETTTLDGSASTDTDGNTLAYLWIVAPTAGVTLSDSTAAVTACTITQTGLYAVVLRVSDADSSSLADTLYLRVSTKRGDISGGGGDSTAPDGAIDADDLLMLWSHFGRNPSSAEWDASLDLDASGRIDHFDFFILGRNFGL
jgi:parallel beta-helix repeat protein